MPLGARALRSAAALAAALQVGHASPLRLVAELPGGPGEPAPDNGTDQWLTKWLGSLNVTVPSANASVWPYDFRMHSMVCFGFRIKGIDTVSIDVDVVAIQAEGIHATCHFLLDWSSHWSWSTTYDVIAKISDARLGSPIRVSSTVAVVPTSGTILLPDKIEAYDCVKNTEFNNISVRVRGGSFSTSLLNRVLIPTLRSTIVSQLCSAMEEAARVNGTGALRSLGDEVRFQMGAKPASASPHLSDPNSDLVDLATNPAMKLIKQITVHVLGNASNTLSLNSIASRFLGPEGYLSLGTLYKLPVSGNVNIPNLGSLNFTLHAAEVSGLNRWSSVLVEAPSARELSYSLGLQGLDANVSVELSIVPDPDGMLSGESLNEPFALRLSLDDVRVEGGASLELNSTHLGLFTVDQLPELGCSAPALRSAVLQGLALTVVPSRLTVLPRGAASLEMDIDHMVNEVVAMLLGQFGATIAEVVRHAAEVNATDALNELVRSRAAEAARLPCPGPLADHTAPELGGFASAASRPLLGLGLLGLALCAAGGLARRLCCLAPPRGEGKAGSAPPHGREGERARGSAAPRRSDGASAAPPRRSDGAGSSFFGEGARGSAAVQEVELAVAPARQEGASQDPGISFSTSANERAGDVRAEAAEAQPSWDCLALHPSVSRMMLVSFPLLIAGNILLMVESNSGVGTSVLISIRANDEQVVRLPSLKDFTLMGSIEDMWNGGAYPLAVLIAFFSGVWPYVKLLTMLLCWLAPTSVLSVHGRQTALEWLDFLGKWSMVDAFVMVLFMVAFKFDLSIAGQAPQVISDVFDEFGGSARLLVYVQPLWGFFLFIGATIGSMVLGHLMTMVHRRAHKVAEFGIRRDSLGRRSRLCDVNRPSGHAGRNFVITPVFFLGVSLLLVVVGLNVNAFQFRFLGLAGFALGEAGSVRPFSVVSLASAVPSANLHSGGPDMFFIQWIFCIFSMAMVIIYHVTLMMLWITPLTNRMQRIGLVAAQVMNAWNALDVFVVSICAGVLEIRQLALFIIGTKCDALDAIVEQFPPIVARVPGAVDGRVHCFDVQSELKEGFFVLLAAVLVSTVVGHLVLHRCSVALACDGEDQCTPPTMVEGSCVEDDLDASFRMVFDRGSLQGPPIVGGVA